MTDDQDDNALDPLALERYALDLLSHIAIAPGDAILELACGTGVLTRHLVEKLPLGASLTATDAREEKLAMARTKVDAVEPVTWQTADASALPFGDDWFDTVITQFGVMRVPDASAAMREVHRVLHPGGTFAFSVWESEGAAVGALLEQAGFSGVRRIPHGVDASSATMRARAHIFIAQRP